MTETPRAVVRARRRTIRSVAFAGLVLALCAGAGTGSALAVAPPDGDGLGQTIDPNQTQGSGRVVVEAGHIDFGPTLNTGGLKLQVHDDTAVPSVWRTLDDVVVRLNDTSVLEVPDDPAYDFLQLDAGTPVHVVPQTQNPDVVWLGWNTQEPQFMSAVTGGVTLSIDGVQGPGDLTVYLQSGNFGEPQVLWSTLGELPAETWVEINTHTHANWVFTKPGEYLVKLRVQAEGIDGSALSTEGIMRVAVGDDTPLEPLYDAAWAEGNTPVASDAPAGEQNDAESSPAADDASLMPIVAAIAGVIVLALIIAIVVIVVTGRTAKRKALAARRASAGEASE